MKNIHETLMAEGTFSKLLTLLEKAGVLGLLNQPGDVTLFAPNDAAFTRLDIDEVTRNPDRMVELVNYHLVDGRYDAEAISKEESLLTRSGKSLTVLVEHGVQVVDNAKYVATDIHCSNGVIHVTDNVFIPQVSGWYCACC